jgi:hypothetical protein
MLASSRGVPAIRSNTLAGTNHAGSAETRPLPPSGKRSRPKNSKGCPMVQPCRSAPSPEREASKLVVLGSREFLIQLVYTCTLPDRPPRASPASGPSAVRYLHTARGGVEGGGERSVCRPGCGGAGLYATTSRCWL